MINRVQPDPQGAAPAWDASAEDWFDSVEDMQAALGSPQGQAVNADAATVLDLSKLQFLVMQEEEVPLRAPAQRASSQREGAMCRGGARPWMVRGCSLWRLRRGVDDEHLTSNACVKPRFVGLQRQKSSK